MRRPFASGSRGEVAIARATASWLALATLAGCHRPPAAASPAPAETDHAGPARAEGRSDWGAATGRLARPLVEEEWTAGLAVGLYAAGRAETYGYGRVSDDGDAPAPGASTLFEIGSATKLFTALALADMAERGEVRLDEPVAELLPDGVTVPSKDGEVITLARLASHTSGLPRMPDNFEPADPANPYADYGADRLYDYLSHAELERAPGARYEYSNLGAGLLGLALARRAGLSYEQLVSRRITGPLGMSDTAVTLSPAMRRRLATGHDAGGKPVPNWDLNALAGAGAIRSTARDMLRFARANLDPPEGELGRAIRATHAPRAERPGGGEVALGWHIGLEMPDGNRILWHNGQTGGYHSFVAFDPEADVAVVALASQAQPMVDKLGAALLQVARGREAELSLPGLAHPSQAELERCVGRYQLSPGFILTVTREGDALYAQATGQPRFRIYPESATHFYYRVVDAQLTFELAGESEHASRVVLHQNGRDVPLARVDD